MLDIDKLKEEQIKLSKNVKLKDDFESLETVAGVDNIFIQNVIISSIVVCKYSNMEVSDKVYNVSRVKIGYISGFRAYREGKAISESYTKLRNKPSVMIFSGNGILHPRRLGLASHMGVLLDAPTIGIAKNLLCGTVEGTKVIGNGKIIGEVVRTKEGSKPVYVSQGHRISLKTSLEIIKKCIRHPHKMPEPLHLAHKQANKIKSYIQKMPFSEKRAFFGRSSTTNKINHLL